jgi:predicted alpha/beta superfamily hydrolase
MWTKSTDIVWSDIGMSKTELSALAPGEPAALHGSVQFDLASAITGRTYRIFVFKPGVEAPPEGYPLVLAVDGNMVFPIMATVDATFELTGKAAIVVGVGYPTSDYLELMRLRTCDLTPPTPLDRIPQRPGLPPIKLEDYGGADDFYRFLTEELIPAISTAHRIDPADQTLYGHSWGGLFTLGVLLKHPEAFRGFIASSPSIWWNRRAILADFSAFSAKVRAGACAPRILVTVGGTEQKVPSPVPAVMLEGVAKRAPYLPVWLRTLVARVVVGKMLKDYSMVDNARAFVRRLKGVRGPKGYSARFHVFGGEDHLTSLPASVGRALDFVLRP